MSGLFLEVVNLTFLGWFYSLTLSQGEKICAHSCDVKKIITVLFQILCSLSVLFWIQQIFKLVSNALGKVGTW